MISVNDKLRKERQEVSEQAAYLQEQNNILKNEIAEYKSKLTESGSEQNSLSEEQMNKFSQVENMLKAKISELEEENEKLRNLQTQRQSSSVPDNINPTVSSPVASPVVQEDNMDVSSVSVPPEIKNIQNAMSRSSLDFEMESYRLQREYELGMLKQLRETFNNLHNLTQFTNSAIGDTINKIDFVLKKN